MPEYQTARKNDPGDLNAVFIKEAQEKALKPHIESGNVNAYVSTFSTTTATINGEYDYSLLADFGYNPELNWGDLDRVLLNGNAVNIVKGTKNKDLAM